LLEQSRQTISSVRKKAKWWEDRIYFFEKENFISYKLLRKKENADSSVFFCRPDKGIHLSSVFFRQNKRPLTKVERKGINWQSLMPPQDKCLLPKTKIWSVRFEEENKKSSRKKTNLKLNNLWLLRSGRIFSWFFRYFREGFSKFSRKSQNSFETLWNGLKLDGWNCSRKMAKMKRFETLWNNSNDDLKSLEWIIHTGSSPVPGTIKRKTSKSWWLLAFLMLFTP
jgi:hypothetical protein